MGGGRRESYRLIGIETQFCKIKKKVLWMDGGVAGTTTCMYVMPLIGTHKKVKMVNFV